MKASLVGAGILLVGSGAFARPVGASMHNVNVDVTATINRGQRGVIPVSVTSMDGTSIQDFLDAQGVAVEDFKFGRVPATSKSPPPHRGPTRSKSGARSSISGSTPGRGARTTTGGTTTIATGLRPPSRRRAHRRAIRRRSSARTRLSRSSASEADGRPGNRPRSTGSFPLPVLNDFVGAVSAVQRHGSRSSPVKTP